MYMNSVFFMVDCQEIFNLIQPLSVSIQCMVGSYMYMVFWCFISVFRCFAVSWLSNAHVIEEVVQCSKKRSCNIKF